jgi:thioesterase domain-containing protein
MTGERDLETYLHRQIPLSAAMQVSVVTASSDEIVLSAPLEPNINHKQTVFGGSASTLGILAAWSIVHVRLLEAGLPCEVVIQSNRMDYDRPIEGSFTARGFIATPSSWPMFFRTLERKGRARIEAESELMCERVMVGRFSGRFVAFVRPRS